MTTRRIFGALGYVGFLLLCTEIALQIFYRATAGTWLFERAAVPIWAPNEWSGFFNKPNLAFRHRTHEFDATSYTNSQGLRVPEGGGDHPLDPAPDATRILLLGPSFAFGWGVDYEETFGHLLERRLEQGGFGRKPRVELINAGVSSLGSGPHLNWFRHVGREFQPALVVRLVHGSMVVRNDPRPQSEATPEGYLVRRDASTRERIVEQAKQSALVFYAWILSTRLDRASSNDTRGEVLGAGREMSLHGAFDVDDPAVVEALAYYRALRDEVRRAGADALVVYFPLSYAVHPEDESRWRHLGVRDVDVQAAFDRAFCDHLTARESLPCIDISEPLRRAAQQRDERLYYWLDVHWTAAGNRVAADAVAAHLLGSGGAS